MAWDPPGPNPLLRAAGPEYGAVGFVGGLGSGSPCAAPINPMINWRCKVVASFSKVRMYKLGRLYSETSNSNGSILYGSVGC